MLNHKQASDFNCTYSSPEEYLAASALCQHDSESESEQFLPCPMLYMDDEVSEYTPLKSINIHLDESENPIEPISSPNTISAREEQFIVSVELGTSAPAITSISSSASPTKDFCRYCFDDVKPGENYSSCYCRSSLCKTCFIRELDLTINRPQSVLRCTVCLYEYDCQIVYNMGNYCAIIKRGCQEFVTFRYTNNTIVDRSTVWMVVLVLSLLSMFPACSVVIGLFFASNTYALLTFADILMNFSIRLFSLKCEEFMQPIVYFMLAIFHCVRVVIMILYRPKKPYVDDILLMCTLSMIYTILYAQSMYSSLKARTLHCLNNNSVLYIEDKGPFSQADFDAVLQLFRQSAENENVNAAPDDEN